MESELWAGIDDGLAEKQPGSGAIYRDSDGEFLFRVPPEYRERIVKDHNDAISRAQLGRQIREAVEAERSAGYTDKEDWHDTGINNALAAIDRILSPP